MKLWRYGQPVEYLGRRYRLDGMLGSGGMADVCLAWDEREGREVALKILKSDDLDQETLNRFMKEAAQIAHWQHPHILRVYESLQVELIDAASGSVLFYMVSEYARGGDLQKRLTTGRPFPLSAGFALFRQLCDAVQYAHERGVIHRDLKPLNMLFRRPESGPEEVVLSDFGLAVQVDASHHTFAHGGTLAYMAPEQFQGHAQPASDIFALGVILYVLCTGGLPFRRSLQDMPRIVQGSVPTPTRPSLLNPELPPALDDVILRAVRELPAERYRQPSEFWEAIELVLTMSAQTFPFVEAFWQNAGQTWPNDGSDQPRGSRQAGQQRQSPAELAALPGEETPEAEEGSVSALRIAREKQKASPAHLPLSDDSILSPPNPPDGAAPEHQPSPRGASAIWQAPDEQARPAPDARPAASASGSTILPGPRPTRRDLEQTSRRRQPFELSGTSAAEPEYQTSRRQPTSQLPDFSARGNSRHQPFERFEPPDAFSDEPEYQTSRRASRQTPAPGSRQRSRRQASALSADASVYQSSRRRVSIHDSSGVLGSSTSGAFEDEDYPTSRTNQPRRQSAAPRALAHPSPGAGGHTPAPPRGTQRTAYHAQGSTSRWKGTRRRGPLFAVLCGLVLLVLLLAIFAATNFQGTLLTFFGAPVTRVTLQANAQLLQETATRTVRTDGSQPGPNEIPGRQLTATSPTQSTTANATGSIPGKRATGQLTFINNGPTAVTLQSTVITGNSGVAISFDGPITIPAIPPTIVVAGFAVNPGANGNIPAFDITKNCCATNVVVKNTSAFTGGQDAQKDSVIQQKDIDGVAQELVASGQAQAQANLQGQVKAGERVAGSAQCQPQINASQKAGDLAKQATVQVAVTCNQTVYDYDAASQSFTQDLQRTANANPALGAAYALSGPFTLTLVGNGTAPGGGLSLQFHAQGNWVYQFKPATLRNFATLIAGKSQDAARSLLLRQPGVLGVQFSNSSPLPVNTGEIQISVQPG